MKLRSVLKAIPALAVATGLTLFGTGPATAQTAIGSTGTPSAAPLTFDGWRTCPVGDPDVGTCVTVLLRSGSIKIGSLSVPLANGALKIAGGVKYVFGNDGSFNQVFVPAPGTQHGVVASPISVPGGVFGLEGPLGLTSVTAQLEAVAAPTLDLFTFEFNLPVRLKLSNPALGNNCYIGTATDPIRLNLRTPNQNGNATEPIGDHPGAVFRAVPHYDRTFSVPGATGCGLFGGLNWAVNLRAGTPSGSGSNTIDIVSDIYNAAAYDVRPVTSAEPATAEPAAVAHNRLGN